MIFPGRTGYVRPDNAAAELSDFCGHTYTNIIILFFGIISKQNILVP